MPESSTQSAVFDDPLQANAVPNRRVPAWLLSCIFHTIIFIAILLALRQVNNGAGNVETRTGGIVLVDMQMDSTEYLSEGDVSEVDPQQAAASNPPPTAAESLLPDLPGMDASESPLTGTGNDLAEAMPGADNMLENTPNNRKLGGRVTTEVFGVKGTGSRFIYVFDRSTSMEGYNAKPLIAAKQALLKSLDSLGKMHQFQIIFYNNEYRVFRLSGLQPEMYFANDETKFAARNFVQSIRGDGGTDHIQALKFALRLAPDVIFLLTDAEGGFTKRELNTISGLNKSATVINAIEFGERRGLDQSLEALARESGGQYVFKNINTLKIDR